MISEFTSAAFPVSNIVTGADKDSDCVSFALPTSVIETGADIDSDCVSTKFPVSKTVTPANIVLDCVATAFPASIRDTASTAFANCISVALPASLVKTLNKGFAFPVNEVEEAGRNPYIHYSAGFSSTAKSSFGAVACICNFCHKTYAPEVFGKLPITSTINFALFSSKVNWIAILNS